MDIKHLLKDHAYQNIPLTFDEAYALGVYVLEGCRGNELAQIQSIATLCALHTRATYEWRWDENKERIHGHTLPYSASDQIAGLCAAVFEKDIAVSPSGFLTPRVTYAMDNCGMGGDLLTTANVSTIAALIAAAAGIPMCKHGSPANADAGRHGSSDFVSLLGIDVYASKERVEECVEREGFGYTEALDMRYKTIHQQTHAVAKLPHMNDIIGPITNPLCTTLLRRRVLGSNHLVSPLIVAGAYHILNGRGITHLNHGIFVRGFADRNSQQGMDELSICVGGTDVVELKDGVTRVYRLTAADFGLDPVPTGSVSPPKGMSKGQFSLAILQREISGPAVQMVLANAALLFYLAGRSMYLKECYRMARDVYESGAAYEKVKAVLALLAKQ